MLHEFYRNWRFPLLFPLSWNLQIKRMRASGIFENWFSRERRLTQRNFISRFRFTVTCRIISSAVVLFTTRHPVCTCPLGKHTQAQEGKLCDIRKPNKQIDTQCAVNFSRTEVILEKRDACTWGTFYLKNSEWSLRKTKRSKCRHF